MRGNVAVLAIAAAGFGGGLDHGGFEMIVKLPWPSPALAPNRSNGKHWGTVAALKAKSKADAYALAKNALNGRKFDPDADFPVSIVFLTPDRRRRDVDGMLSSLKSSLDGIAQAIGVDDRHFRPILVDWECIGKESGVIVGIGVAVVSGASLHELEAA